MKELIVAGLLGAVIATFALLWYYRPKIVALEAEVTQGKAVGEALEEERTTRQEADQSRAERTEARWQEDRKASLNEKDMEAALARWSRVRRTLRLPHEGD